MIVVNFISKKNHLLGIIQLLNTYTVSIFKKNIKKLSETLYKFKNLTSFK